MNVITEVEDIQSFQMFCYSNCSRIEMVQAAGSVKTDLQFNLGNFFFEEFIAGREKPVIKPNSVIVEHRLGLR